MELLTNYPIKDSLLPKLPPRTVQNLCQAIGYRLSYEEKQLYKVLTHGQYGVTLAVGNNKLVVLYNEASILDIVYSYFTNWLELMECNSYGGIDDQNNGLEIVSKCPQSKYVLKFIRVNETILFDIQYITYKETEIVDRIYIHSECLMIVVLAHLSNKPVHPSHQNIIALLKYFLCILVGNIDEPSASELRKVCSKL